MRTSIKSLPRAILLLLATHSVVAEILPADKRINWADSTGIPGGIPNRTTIFTTLVLDATGVNDVTGQINAAINACPNDQVVQLTAGNFRVDNQLRMKEGVTLRGAGMTNTVLRTKYGSSSLSFDSPIDYTIARPILGGFTKGSTTITVSSSTGFSVGMQVMVDQVNDPAWVNTYGGEGGPGNSPDPVYSRAAGAYVEITAINGNTLTINPPFPWNFSAGQNPLVNLEGTGSKSSIRWSGVEALTLSNALPTGQAVEKMIHMRRAAYCWLKNVEVRRSGNVAVGMTKAFRSNIEGCTFHGISHTYAGSGIGYCVQSDYKASFNLIQNNISTRLLGLCTLEYGSYGNVIAYNFTTNNVYGTISPPDTWMGADYSTHAVHQGYELFEGNIGDLWAPDFIHGSSSHLTAFRNHFRGIATSKPQHNRTIEIDAWNRYCSAIGNVLGGTTYGWVQGGNASQIFEAAAANTYVTGDIKCIYRIGYPSVNYPNQYGIPFDNGMVSGATAFVRHGNWDAINNQTRWDPSNPDQVLPLSLYLSAKPSWWGSNFTWPAIGPNLNPMVSANPAMRRWLGIPEGSGPTDPPVQPPTNDCVTLQGVIIP